jgi:hypothetical protein
MRALALRSLTWLQTRSTTRDESGVETAEVLMWMAGGAVLIAVLIGRMDDIMNRVVDTIDAALPG